MSNAAIRRYLCPVCRGSFGADRIGPNGTRVEPESLVSSGRPHPAAPKRQRGSAGAGYRGRVFRERDSFGIVNPVSYGSVRIRSENGLIYRKISVGLFFISPFAIDPFVASMIEEISKELMRIWYRFLSQSKENVTIQNWLRFVF